MTSSFDCPHCGKSNPIDARFCSFCGAHLGDDKRSRPTQTQYDKEIRDKKSPAPPTQPERSWELPPFQTTPKPHQDDDDDQPDVAKPSQRSRLHRPSLRPQITFQPSALSSQDPQAPSTKENRDEPDTDLPEFADPTAWFERFSPVTPAQSSTILTAEMRRQLRQVFVTEVPLIDVPPSADPLLNGEGLWRRSRIYWLLLAVLVTVLIFKDDAPVAQPHTWSGIAQAFATLETLPAGSTVLINWAYDPTTAGEMNLIVRPVVEHLLTQNVDIVIVSQLPLGSATARRMIATVSTSTLGGAVARQLDVSLVDGGFLPGGAATLPLLGQAPILGIPVDLLGRTAPNLPPLVGLQQNAPTVVLIMADRFEPVQHWLEQVQPLNNVPVVAVTSAAPGPALRPYLDSGQLVGLVSGYNGGISYGELLLRPLDRAQQAILQRQIAGHNWALVLLLIVIVAGNLTSSFGRQTP